MPARSTLLCLALLGAPLAAADPPRAADTTYVVRLEDPAAPRFHVRARWPGGARLTTDTTRPGDVPELLEGGWPALVRDLRVHDGAGNPVAFEPDGDAGWRLGTPHDGPLLGEYTVDTRLLAEHGWAAPREAVFVEPGFVSIVGRALFVAADRTDAARVEFDLPSGWRAFAPWAVEEDGRRGPVFRAASVARLRENLVVLTRSTPTVLGAAGFRLTVVPLGPWATERSDVRRVLRDHTRRFVSSMGFTGQGEYLAVLLPFADRGAESYRQSLALTFPEAPGAANRAAWANLLGHEVFHYWNGWRLAGADYGPSQWIQEGFTEYAANVSTAAGGFMTEAQLLEKLGSHVANSRRLTTSLAAGGTRKGPPLYSAGALVAFAVDLRIRETTGEERGIGDFWRALDRRLDRGARPYTHDDLVASLEEVAPGGAWEAFLEALVHAEPPVDFTSGFALAGLRVLDAGDGAVRVEVDPGASPAASRRWRALVRGR